MNNGITATPPADKLNYELVLQDRKSKTVMRGPDEENQTIDPQHLQSMKNKLQQIQSNKMMLETRIKEYESQLMSIASHEPEYSSAHHSESQHQHSVMESGKTTPSSHIFNTQERARKRTAFQQLTQNTNMTRHIDYTSFKAAPAGVNSRKGHNMAPHMASFH